jgi:hypothetical protein
MTDKYIDHWKRWLKKSEKIVSEGLTHRTGALRHPPTGRPMATRRPPDLQINAVHMNNSRCCPFDEK